MARVKRAKKKKGNHWCQGFSGYLCGGHFVQSNLQIRLIFQKELQNIIGLKYLDLVPLICKEESVDVYTKCGNVQVPVDRKMPSRHVLKVELVKIFFLRWQKKKINKNSLNGFVTIISL